MTRVHEIVFNNLSGVENVPEHILDAVPDVNDIHFKSDCFVNPIPEPVTIDHVFQIDEALKAEGKEPTTLQDKVEKCFPVGSVWKRSEFETSLYQISSKYKFAWRCDSNRYFQCLKSGKKRSTSEKKEEDIQSSKNECPWKICVANLWTFPKTSKGGRRATWSAMNPSDDEKNNMFIVIKKIPTEEHNHPLDIETYQQTVQKCGVLGRALNADSYAVRNCLLFRQRKGYLSNEVIQAFCEESTPNFVCWNSEKCNNFKKKIERLYTTMSPEQYNTQNVFEANFKSKKIQEMFNDDMGDAVYTDKVSQLALAQRLKLLIDSTNELSPNTQKSKIHAWFEELRTIDPYFDYEMMKNENDKIIGMVWMTGQMRRDLEEYGGYIMLDFMKKEKNINLFPYASVVMFRPSGQLCLGSEALFFTESTATYKFLCDATFRMAYQRTKESVLVIASDEFLDQNRVTNELGFTNARLILDQFHLVVVNLAKKLSASGAFEKLQKSIYEWINASSETLFDQAFESLKYQMKGLHCTSSQESAVRELFDKRDYFAAYKLRSYKGTLRRKGNSGSESNHASVAQHLDSKNLLEIPQMHAMLVQRQKRWNYEMMRKFQKEELQLIRLNSIAENPMLKKASSCVDGKSLCLTGYKLFREQFQISLELKVIEVDSNGATKFDDGITCKNGEECSCEYRQADLIQCCHEIKLSQSFDIGAFDRRYHYHIRPWDRRIKRNNYNSDDFQDKDDHHVNVQEGTALLPNQSHTEVNPSPTSSTLNYQYLLEISKNTAEHISHHKSYSFKAESAGVILAIGEIARNGVESISGSNPTELLRSFIDGQSDSMNSSMMIDPSKKSKNYHPMVGRPLFQSEIMRGKGNQRKRKTVVQQHDKNSIINVRKPDPICKFCHAHDCKNKSAAKKCPKLLDYGGTIITRSNDTTKDEQNRNFLKEISHGPICQPSKNKRAPTGTLSTVKYNKHVIVHSVHKREGYNNNAIDFDVLITTIDPLGDKNCIEVLVDSAEFNSFVGSRATTRFIIDRRQYDSSHAVPRQEQHVHYNPGFQGFVPPNDGYHMNFSQGMAFGMSQMSQGIPNSQPLQSQQPQYTNPFSQPFPYAMSQNNIMGNDFRQHTDPIFLNERNRIICENQKDDDADKRDQNSG